ncbi:hypothetical protein Q6249_29815, partial [Klebsiella pneumoniae]
YRLLAEGKPLPAGHLLQPGQMHRLYVAAHWKTSTADGSISKITGATTVVVVVAGLLLGNILVA